MNGKTRTKCYMDVAIGHDAPKRIVVELAVHAPAYCIYIQAEYGCGLCGACTQDDIAPKTVENFKKVRWPLLCAHSLCRAAVSLLIICECLLRSFVWAGKAARTRVQSTH